MKKKKRTDVGVLICGLWGDHDFIPVEVPGSTPDYCKECGKKVCVAPSGRAILAAHKTSKILCMVCGLLDMERAEHGEIGMPTRAQVEEIIEARRRREARPPSRPRPRRPSSRARSASP